MADLEFEVTSDSSQARRDLTSLDRSIGNIETDINSASRSLVGFQRSLRTAFTFLASAGITTGIARTTDTVRALNSQLRLATTSQEAFGRAQRDVNRITIQTRGDLTAVGNLYARIARTAGTLGATQEETARATQAISQTLQISGTNAQAASGALLQLGQALASGALRGDELNSVLEGIPRLAQAIADELGVLPGMLRDIARTGAITSEVVFQAILAQSQQINSEAAQISLTFGQSLQVLSTGATVLVSALDMSIGFSELIANNILQLGITLNDVGLRIPAILEGVETRFGIFTRTVNAEFRILTASIQQIFGLDFDFDFSDIGATAQTGFQTALASFERFRSAVTSAISINLNLPDLDFTPALESYNNLTAAIASTPAFQTAQAAFTAFTTFISNAFDALFIAVIGGSSYTDLIDGIIERTNDLLGGPLTTISQFVNSITSSFDSISAPSFEAFQTTFDNLRDSIANNPITIALIGEFEEFRQSLIEAFNALTVGDFNTFANRLGQAVTNILPGAVGLAASPGLVSTIISELQGALDSIDVNAFATRIGEGIQSFLEGTLISLGLRQEALPGDVPGPAAGEGTAQAVSTGFSAANLLLDVIAAAVGGTFTLLSTALGSFSFTELAGLGAAILALSSGARGAVGGVAAPGQALGGAAANQLINRRLQEGQDRLQALSIAAAQIGEIETQGLRDYNAQLAAQGEINSGLATAQRQQNMLSRDRTRLLGELRTVRQNTSLTDQQRTEQLRRLQTQLQSTRVGLQTAAADAATFNTRLTGTGTSLDSVTRRVSTYTQALMQEGLTRAQAIERTRQYQSQLNALNTELERRSVDVDARRTAIIQAGTQAGQAVGGAAGGIAGFTVGQNFVDYLENNLGADFPAWAEAGITMGASFAGQIAGAAVGDAVGTAAGIGLAAVLGRVSLVGFATAIASALGTIGIAAFSAIGINIVGAMAAASASLSLIGGSIVAGIAGAGAATLAGIGAAIVAGIVLPTLAFAVPERFQAVLEDFLRFSPEWAEAITTFIASPVQWIVDIIDVFRNFELTPAWFGELGSTILQLVTGPAMWVAQLVDFVARLVLPPEWINTLENIFNNFRDAINSLFDRISGFLGIATGDQDQATVNQQQGAEALDRRAGAFAASDETEDLLTELSGELQSGNITLEEAMARINTAVDGAGFIQANLLQSVVMELQRINARGNQQEGLTEFQTGGLIRGAGTGTSDSILARISNGEYVIRASTVNRLGIPFLDALNEGRLPGFATGGLIRFQEGGLVEGLGQRAGAAGLDQATQNTFNSVLREIERLNQEQRDLADLTRSGVDVSDLIAASTDRLNERISAANGILDSVASNTADTADNTAGGGLGGGGGTGANEPMPLSNLLNFDEDFQVALSDSFRDSFERGISQGLRSGDFSSVVDSLLDTVTGSIIDQFASNLTSGIFGGSSSGGTAGTNLFGSLAGLFGGGGGGGGFGSLLGLFGGIFQTGGIVPGPRGRPVPVIAEGGEAILNPRQQAALFSGGGMGTNNVTVSLNVTGNVDDATRRAVRDMGNELTTIVQTGLQERRAIQ